MDKSTFTAKKTYSLIAIVGISAITALGVTYAANNYRSVRKLVK